MEFKLPSISEIRDSVPGIMTGLGAGMEYGGNNIAAANAREMAARQAAAFRFKQQQYAVNAGQAVAAGQMDAAEQRRQGQLIQSRAQALAAASGAGAVDPSVVHIMGQNAGEIALRANIALYKGEEQARMLRMQAAAEGHSAGLAIEAGENKANAFEMAGRSALFKGAGSLFTKYGFGQPKAGSDTAIGNNDASLQSSASWDTPAWQGSGA